MHQTRKVPAERDTGHGFGQCEKVKFCLKNCGIRNCTDTWQIRTNSAAVPNTFSSFTLSVLGTHKGTSTMRTVYQDKCGLNFVSPLSTICINPLPDDKILDWSKFKQIADDILKGI